MTITQEQADALVEAHRKGREIYPPIKGYLFVDDKNRGTCACGLAAIAAGLDLHQDYLGMSLFEQGSAIQSKQLADSVCERIGISPFTEVRDHRGNLTPIRIALFYVHDSETITEQGYINWLRSLPEQS